MTDLQSSLRHAIHDVPDFPKPGILFKDITPLLRDPELFRRTTAAMSAPFAADAITHVVAIESRGFILGAPVAQSLGAGFVPVRKLGKLPKRTERVEYALEYGTDFLEIHADAIAASDRVLIVDDVLATGGTAAAVCNLVERLGAHVTGCSFLLTLGFLSGAAQLGTRRICSLLEY